MNAPVFAQAKYGFGDEFQIQVLALCLRDPEFLPRYADILSHTYFEHETVGTLAYLVLQKFKETSTTPTKDVVGFLVREHAREYDPDGALQMEHNLLAWVEHLYVRQLDSSEVAIRVERFGRRQAMKQALLQSIEVLRDEKGLVDGEEDGAPAAIQAIIDGAARKGTTRDFGIEFVANAALLPQMLQDERGPGQLVPTGWGNVDEDLMGGLGVAEIGVIQAPPNGGKSTTLVSLGKNASEYFAELAITGHPLKSVIHITCEQRTKPLLRKYGSAWTGVNQKDVLAGTPEYLNLITERTPTMAPIIVKWFRPGSTTAEEITWWIASLQMAEGIDPGLIIIDYADRLKGGEDDRFKGMGVIYDKLIAMGDRFQCPVWTATQTRRASSKDGVQGMDGVAESWKKAEAADVIISVNRNEAEEERKAGRLYTAKVRDGEARKIYPVWFDPGTVQIREMSDDEAKMFKAGIAEDDRISKGGNDYLDHLNKEKNGGSDDGTYVEAPGIEAPPPMTASTPPTESARVA